jgi:hypothetical protein
MDLIQLKMPPDKAAAMADAIEWFINTHPAEEASKELGHTLTWLRYRVQRWNDNHPTVPAA